MDGLIKDIEALDADELKQVQNLVSSIKKMKDPSTSPCIRRKCVDVASCCGCPEYREWKKNKEDNS